MDKLKAQASPWILLLAIIAILGLVMLYKPPAKVAVPVEYEGEFTKIGAPDEVTGTWLSISADQTVEQNGVYNFSTKSQLATVGSVYPLAFRFDVDEIFKEVEIEVTKVSDEVDFAKVYILPDEDEITMDESNALYKAEIDMTEGVAEFEIAGLSDETYDSYVLVVEAKVTDPAVNSTYVTSGEHLFKIVFDGKSDGDVTDFTVNLLNA